MRTLLIFCFWLWSMHAFAADPSETEPRFVSFPTIIVNTSDGLTYNGLFSVKLQLQVTGNTAYEQVQALRPQYQDALTQATFRMGQMYVDPRKPVPWARLMRELKAAVLKVSPKMPTRILIMEATTRATS